MKKSYFILFIAFCLCACSRQTYQTQSVGFMAEKNGVFTVRSTGYGNNKKDAINSAEQNAIEQVLFRGIPDSQQSLPLVSVNESSVKADHKQYFEEMLENGRYKSFIISSVPVSNYCRTYYGKRSVTLDVSINLNSLRSDLETQNIIRKFGY